MSLQLLVSGEGVGGCVALLLSADGVTLIVVALGLDVGTLYLGVVSFRQLPSDEVEM